MSKIRVVLQKNYEKYKFLKVFLIVYFTNYHDCLSLRGMNEEIKNTRLEGSRLI